MDGNAERLLVRVSHHHAWPHRPQTAIACGASSARACVAMTADERIRTVGLTGRPSHIWVGGMGKRGPSRQVTRGNRCR
jgi:hypothetical protein